MNIVFDLGGTKTRVAGSPDGIRLGEVTMFATPKTYAEGFLGLTDAIKAVAGHQKVTAVAGGIAGTLNQERDQLVRSPNLGDWIGQPVAHDLVAQLNCPVKLENDTALVGIGEATAGAGQGKAVVVYVTVSTGVNAARIVNGRVEQRVWNSEIGYEIIGQTASGEPVRLETLIGGHSVEERYHSLPSKIKDETLWHNLTRTLAIAIHNAVLHWSPEMVVLGGHMMKDISLPELQNDLGQILTAYPEPPELRLAELDDRGGLMGGLHILKDSQSS